MLQYLFSDFPIFGKLGTVVIAILLRCTAFEFFQFLGIYFQLAIFSQNIQLDLQIFNLLIQAIQL